MSMDAGKLRHRVTLQSRVETQDSTTGEPVISWASQGDVWAAIEPLSAREFIQSNATQAQIVARITIRYRADINATWRAVHGGKLYNIEGVLADKDSGLEYLTLPVSQGVSAGQ